MSVYGIQSIPPGEVSRAQVEGNLPDRPSQRGMYGSSAMSPAQIKAAYDKLPKLIVEYYNALVSAISSQEEDGLSSYIFTGIKANQTIKDFFDDIKSGEYATYFNVGDMSLLEFYEQQISQNVQVGSTYPNSDTPGTMGSIYIMTSLLDNVTPVTTNIFVCVIYQGVKFWVSYNETMSVPLATTTRTGGVKPIQKTEDMVLPVGIDNVGKLWTEQQFYDDGTYPDMSVGKDSDGNVITETYVRTNDAAYQIQLDIDSSTYVMTVRLKNKSGADMSYATVDLPLESVVVGGRYDKIEKKVILVLQNKNEISFEIAELVSGLVNEGDFEAALNDMADVTLSLSQSIQTLDNKIDNKYTLPSSGIPEGDLSSTIVNKLNKATEVVANPVGEADDELVSIRIGNISYSIPVPEFEQSGGVVAVDTLPDCSEAEYDKHLLYLCGGTISYMIQTDEGYKYNNILYIEQPKKTVSFYIDDEGYVCYEYVGG